MKKCQITWLLLSIVISRGTVFYENQLPKLVVVGSNPIARSIPCLTRPGALPIDLGDGISASSDLVLFYEPHFVCTDG